MMPDSEIAVSVVVYARNAQRKLPRCLRALQGQTLRAGAGMEAIVVDGGSGDRTHEIALEYHTADPEFVRVHRQSRADPSCAGQTGLALARGKYVAFCGAGDTAPPGRYRALYEACEMGSLEFAGVAGANIWDRALRGMLARREFLLAHGLPVKTGCARAEQLAAYGTLRTLVSADALPLFCAGWVDTLRGVCLEEYRKSGGGAAFYERMISLAGEPQVMEAIALAGRSALAGGRRRFYDAFRARDWGKVERYVRH
ncbi:MAG: glycosyltransferase [Oscillospiraceae bacterium]|jgi:glycosyltransferase involved in cell wall biosynthesis|nr:glycosyltransferase [Oscillospiraceae bacterium]